MSYSENVEVGMDFGFALRGDRQVERGLDSIMERFIRTGSVAEASALAVEKFGRVFEVGLPVALGAVALGMAIEKIYQVGEEAVKTHEKIDKLTSIPLADMDVSGIESNLADIGNELESIGTEHGKKYGESFFQAMTAGAQKLNYNLYAAIANNVPGAAKVFNALDLYPGLTDHNKSFDEANGDVGKLSNRARQDMNEVDSRNGRSIDRLNQKEMISLVESQQKNPASMVSRNLIAHMKLTNADRNVSDDKKDYNKAANSYSTYQSSIADGHNLTNTEIQNGIRLQKLLNETHTKLIEDTIAQDEAVKEARKITKEANSVASGMTVSRGGFGVYSSHFSSPPSKGIEGLREFTDAIKEHTESVRSSYSTKWPFSTPVF